MRITYVPRTLSSMREYEAIKKDSFTSQCGIIADEDDDELYQILLRTQRWWLEYRNKNRLLQLDFYTNWRVPIENLRFANELFVEGEYSELQIIWDKNTRRYFLERCNTPYDNSGEIPILRLYKSYPIDPPDGLFGVCKKPINVDNPYDYYGVTTYVKLGGHVKEIPMTEVFN